MFTNSGPTIQLCNNLGVATINNVQFNLVSDLHVGVYLYDTDWNYVSTFNFPKIHYAIVANDYYYFSTTLLNSNSYGIIKTLLNSSSIVKYYGNTRGVYRNLFYDSNQSRIIAAGYAINTVDIFDLNLKLNSSIFLGNFNFPFGVTVYNSNIYAAYAFNIVKISIASIAKTYSTTCLLSVSINADSFGYFAFACTSLCVYDSTFRFTYKCLSVTAIDARFDTNNRLAICTVNDVYVYY